MTYLITYARLIILTTTVEAANEGEAYTKAAALDIKGELGLATATPKPGSTLVAIQDHDDIWTATEQP